MPDPSQPSSFLDCSHVWSEEIVDGRPSWVCKHCGHTMTWLSDDPEADFVTNTKVESAVSRPASSGALPWDLYVIAVGRSSWRLPGEPGDVAQYTPHLHLAGVFSRAQAGELTKGTDHTTYDLREFLEASPPARGTVAAALDWPIPGHPERRALDCPLPDGAGGVEVCRMWVRRQPSEDPNQISGELNTNLWALAFMPMAPETAGASLWGGVLGTVAKQVAEQLHATFGVSKERALKALVDSFNASTGFTGPRDIQ